MNRSTRRTALLGAGVTMALPWMESLRAGDDKLSTENPVFPKRFAALFMGNGINADHWWAKGAGDEMELSQTLEQLDPFKKKLNVVTGLFNRNANGVGIHPGQTGIFSRVRRCRRELC